MNTSGAASATAKQRAWLLAIWQIAICLAACAILFSRRPDAIVHAQFYAEDGHVWFADAYNRGWWRALFYAQDGYFQTCPRLGAALALLFPMARAPLVLNVIAIVIEALPVNLLLSSRSSAWGSLRFRICLAGVYLALPNTVEISLGITESQWLLALSVFLLLVADVPRGRAGRCFDLFLLLLSGLSGPFCIFLLPFAIFLAWRRRDPRRRTPAIALAACGLAQAFSLFVLDAHIRPHYTLGVNAAMFARLVGGNVVLGTLVGRNFLAAKSGSGLLAVLVCATVIGMAIVVVCFVRSKLEMRLFLVLTGMLFAGSILSPVTYPPPGSTVWHVLAYASACRYWFFPSVAFAWSLLWCARSLGGIWKMAPAILLGLMCFCVVLDWREPAQNASHYAEYIGSFQAAPTGTVMTFPENPDGWNVRLVKHGSF
jgi:hypothetical protein